MHIKFKLSTFSLALLTLSATAAFSAHPEYLTKDNQNIESAYWTPIRMQNAKPMPMPKVDPNKIIELPQSALPNKNDGESGDGKSPEEINFQQKPQQLYTPRESAFNAIPHLDRGTSNEAFSSTRLVPITADTSYPYRAVGKLFFTIPGQGDYVCSASVLRPRVLLTAGHCLHKGSGGSDGFYTNFKFVPAFRDGSAPYLAWNWSYVIVTETWANGGGTVPNAADYGMLELVDNSINGVFTRIGSLTGYFGYQTLSLIPNHTNMLGYPCNFDSCQKMHQVTAQSAKAISPNNAEYGSDMSGGSSGGPWVQNFGALAVGQTGGLNPGLNRVVGVTSYGYISSDPKAQGASIFDSRFTDILNTVCSHKSGNCS
jgi:V8-like Glu-specific endopeptidase